MFRLMCILVAIALSTAADSATAQSVPADTVEISGRIVHLLRQSHEGAPIDLVPSARALRERRAVCEDKRANALCHLPGPQPVYLISHVTVWGDSATARVTRFRDSPSMGIASVTRTWVLVRRDSQWTKVGVRSSETLIVN